MNNQNDHLLMDHPPLMLLVRVFKVLLMLALIIFIAVWTVNKVKEQKYIGKSDQFPNTIAISGEGKVVAVPDIATLSLGVVTEKKEVAAAQKENTEKVNKIVDELKKLKIAKEDIQTTTYQIYPKYNWTQDKGQELTGYEINQSVQVKIRDMEKIGEVLAKAATLGANQIGGLNFTIDEPEKIKQEAREKALKNALEKAGALSKMAGVKLGKLVSFSESSNDYMPQPYYESSAKLGMGGGGAVAPSIEAGSTDIVVYVTVNYEIN